MKHLISLAMGVAVAAVGPLVLSGPAAAATGPQTVATYSFDGGAMAGLRVVGRAGGTTHVVPGVSGSAIGFPAKCGGNCPRAILEGADDPALDPGTRPIRYGAHVQLRTEQTTNGSNVMQKGVWSSSSQWKLQVDGVAGRPSCALMGTGARKMYVATAPLTVADGRWHQVTCVRAGASLRIEVDGVVRANKAIPAGLSVSNSAPLRIGGNGVSPSSDRFHGAVDNLFVTVG